MTGGVHVGAASLRDHAISPGLEDGGLGDSQEPAGSVGGISAGLQGDGLARTRRAQARSTRGYFGIVAWHSKYAVNIGTLWRSASIFGAAFIGTVGRRYDKQGSDTMQTPRHTPLFHWIDEWDFWAHIPVGCVPVAVEIAERARDITTFRHPQSAVYLLGPEDGSLPEKIAKGCPHVIQIPGRHCLNLAVAGSIVMYDRIAKVAA